MIAQLKSTLTDNRKALMLSIMVGLFVAMSTVAGAAGDDATVTSITSSFTNIKDTALAALGAIAGIAILLFGAIYAWRYGKKVFTIIAK